MVKEWGAWFVPTPVMTTRLCIFTPMRKIMTFDQPDCVFDGPPVAALVIRDIDLTLLFDVHDDFNHVIVVGMEISFVRRGVYDPVHVDSGELRDHLPDPVPNLICLHRKTPLKLVFSFQFSVADPDHLTENFHWFTTSSWTT
jgi:hypothetical protein